MVAVVGSQEMHAALEETSTLMGTYTQYRKPPQDHGITSRRRRPTSRPAKVDQYLTTINLSHNDIGPISSPDRIKYLWRDFFVFP